MGLASVLAEAIISGLIAPIMMLMQSRSVMEVLVGRDSGWQPQQRDGRASSIGGLLRVYGWPTILGLLLSIGAYAISTSLFLWMTPVLIGLVLALPLAALTSSPSMSAAFFKLGLLATPEEADPPRVLARANALASRPNHHRSTDALITLAEKAELLAAHVAMLPENPKRRKGEFDVDLLVASAIVHESESIDEATNILSAKEKFSILSDLNALNMLMRKGRDFSLNPACQAGQSQTVASLSPA